MWGIEWLGTCECRLTIYAVNINSPYLEMSFGVPG